MPNDLCREQPLVDIQASSGQPQALGLLHCILTELHAWFRLPKTPATQLMSVLARTADHLVATVMEIILLGKELAVAKKQGISRQAPTLKFQHTDKLSKACQS